MTLLLAFPRAHAITITIAITTSITITTSIARALPRLMAALPTLRRGHGLPAPISIEAIDFRTIAPGPRAHDHHGRDPPIHHRSFPSFTSRHDARLVKEEKASVTG